MKKISHRFYFVLADCGMGKITFLTNLFSYAAAISPLSTGGAIMMSSYSEDGEKKRRYALIGASREAHEESPYR